jgi:lipoprotein
MSSFNSKNQTVNAGHVTITGCANVYVLGNSPEVNVGELGDKANQSEAWEKLSAIAKIVKVFVSLFTAFSGISR